MRLLTGPAGSGKTAFVLDRVREALRTQDPAVRLLVPTATMAQHLQNRLAREGLVFSPSAVQTLSGFVDGWAADLPQAPEAVLYLIVEQAIAHVRRPEFARVAHMPGFCASVARTIGEFASAGCDSARLACFLPEAPLGPAFLAVYREVDRELERRGLALRGRRLEHAAERIRQEGTPGIRTVLMDGFHALPDPELRVIAALGGHTDLTLTLTGTDLTDAVRARLFAMGFRAETMPRRRPTPALALVKAAGIEREAEEIARRILKQAAAGRPFREIGIIVRAGESYVPVLRTTLERFGIPARFYFDEDLERQPATRFVCGLVDAMLGGWDHEQTLGVLRLAPRFADSNAMDRFDFDVREQIPNAGLGELKSLLVPPEGRAISHDAERLLHKIESVAAIEEWRSFALAPKDWAARLKTLGALYRRARPEHRLDHRMALELRSQSAALRAFDEALDEASAALDRAHPIGLAEFWRAVKAVLRLKPLRVPDARRNVVHVLSAPEARQWVLPVVFVCGMVEKQFPQVHRQDPFFPDAAHCRLNAAGIRVRTAEEFEREERGLFDSAVTRATMLTVLSYPEFDARGDRNLPSLFLEELDLVPEDARAVRVAPRHAEPSSPRVEIQSPELREFLREKSARQSPTRLESYLQCPFQYFAARTLRLHERPALPEERLDFLTQGNIVHAVLARWYPAPRDIDALFAEEFARAVEENRIPGGYHTERLRNAMLDDLRAFARDGRWPLPGLRALTEQQFEFALNDSLTIAGKIDRLDLSEDGRGWVTDYKYSRSVKAKVEDQNLLQAPLYLIGAQRVFGVAPAGMQYVGLKAGVEIAGWDDGEFPDGFFENAEIRTLHAVEQIRGGTVAPRPADPGKCGFCDYRDVCRFETRAGEAMAGDA
jgi:ATP-dependent helicase/nuclease subunit B